MTVWLLRKPKKRKEIEKKISIGDSMNSKVELLEQGQGHMFLAEGNSEPNREQNQEDSLQFNASNWESYHD